MPMPKPMPGLGRAPDGLGQPVVAPAAADGVLGRGERCRREFERGAGVVVEAPHQSRFEPVGDAELVQAGPHPGQVRGARLVEVVGDARRTLGDGSTFGPLAVQYPQRVRPVPLPVLVAQRVGVRLEVGEQGGHVGGPTLPTPHGVDRQVHLAKPQPPVEIGGQRDNLDVHVGIVGAEHLHPELVVLLVAARLGALVAECGRDVPRLPRHGRTVLDEGPDHRGRALGTQGDGAPAPIFELVHLFSHDVALVPDAPTEELGVLEHGVEHEAEARPLRPSGELGHEPLPARRLGPQHVVGARRGAQRRRFLAHL